MRDDETRQVSSQMLAPVVDFWIKGVTSPLGFGSVHAAPGADRGSYRQIEPFSMRLRHLHYLCACLFLAGTRGYITTKAEVLEEEVSKRKTVVSSLDAAPVNLLSTS